MGGMWVINREFISTDRDRVSDTDSCENQLESAAVFAHYTFKNFSG